MGEKQEEIGASEGIRCKVEKERSAVKSWVEKSTLDRRDGSERF
jgi:hypothetical protein